MSKSWSSLLSSRYFCNRFLVFPSLPQTPLVYMSLSDIFDSSKSLLLSSSAAAPSSSSVVILDQDMTIPEMGFRYLCVLHGLICFTICKSASIYNPTTRQLVILPVINSDILYVDVKYYIGHDPINYEYKILCTTIAVTHSYLNSTTGGSWKRVAKEFLHHHPSTLQLTMNGVLYYLA